MEVITSLSNKKVKDWCKLKNKKYRDEDFSHILPLQLLPYFRPARQKTARASPLRPG